MTRDSREFSAALVLGALGGAAVALALRSDTNRGRSRAWRDLVSGVDWREALAGFRSAVENQATERLGSVAGSVSRSGSRSGLRSGARTEPGAGRDTLRWASRRLSALGGRVASSRR